MGMSVVLLTLSLKISINVRDYPKIVEDCHLNVPYIHSYQEYLELVL